MHCPVIPHYVTGFTSCSPIYHANVVCHTMILKKQLFSSQRRQVKCQNSFFYGARCDTNTLICTMHNTPHVRPHVNITKDIVTTTCFKPHCFKFPLFFFHIAQCSFSQVSV